MIKIGYDNKRFKLIDLTTGNEVNENDDIVSFRGVSTKVINADAPHKPSSSGFVNGYYASVYNLKWEELK